MGGSHRKRLGHNIDTLVYIAVIFAAVLHAGWNAVLRIGLDRNATMVLLAIVQALVAILLLHFVTQPAPAAWAWIVGAGLLHAGYKVFLVQAYNRADLTQVYPLARGTAPLIIALVAFLFLEERIAPIALLAVALISGGIMILAFKSAGGARMTSAALFFALGTAVFTASYTLFDAVGARIAGTASGCILWMVIVDAIFMLIYWVALKRSFSLTPLLPAWKSGFFAGTMSLGSYWIAIWAFTQAPVATVAALRESSIAFAVLIAYFFLKEPVNAWRWGSAGAIALGVFLLKA